MHRCPQRGCRWQSLAPTPSVAREQYVEHLIDAHTTEVDADIPDGMVQIHVGDGNWVTVTPEEARRLHDERH